MADNSNEHDQHPYSAQEQRQDILQNLPQPQPVQIDENMIGAIKIKDALFIGDELAAQDLEFVVNNKVTHVIN